jgi:hypothetical protein
MHETTPYSSEIYFWALFSVPNKAANENNNDRLNSTKSANFANF